MKRSRSSYVLPFVVAVILSLTGLTLHPGGNGSAELSVSACLPVDQGSMAGHGDFRFSNVALVSHITHDFITLIDLSNNEVVDTIHAGEGTDFTARVPGKDELYIADFNSNDIAVVDGQRMNKRTKIPVGIHPVCVSFTPNGKTALISYQSQDGLWFMDTKTHAITRKISDGTGMIYYLKSRNLFYQPAIFRPFVHIIDPVRQEIIKSVWVGGRPMSLAFTPDGKFAYIPNYDLNEVQVFSTALDSVVRVIPKVGNPRGVAISPDGRYALVTNVTSNTLTVINIDSNSVVKVIAVDRMPTDVAVRPDGKYAYVTNQGSGSISVIDMAGLDVSAHIEVADDPISITIPN